MATTDLLTTGEVAKALGVSRQHVVNMCDRGDISSILIGKHRRVPVSEVERLQPSQLTRAQEKSLWLHRAILSALMIDPSTVLQKARHNIARWKGSHRPDGMTYQYLTAWEAVLDEGIDAVAEVLTSPSPEACELRQNTPFAGVVPDGVRSQVLRAFNQHWESEHKDQRVS